jgi:hypothetical protein
MAYVASLTSADIEFGKQIAERLRERGFGVQGIFWLYDEINDDWRLVIATDAVDKLGPRGTYLQVTRHTSDIQGSDFQKMRIQVVSPQIPLIQALRSAFGPAANVAGATLRNTVIDGILVPEAYLYELSG